MTASNYYDNETELSAVNSILGAIGQAPVSRIYQPQGDDKKLTFINPEVSFIYQLLMEVNADIQNEGWVFNTENHYEISPNSNDEILIPPNVLRLDVSDDNFYRTTDVVIRGGKLYNKLDHSYKFTQPMKFDVVWKFPYEDLPSPFKRYITCKASTRAATQLVASENLTKMLNSNEAIARANLMEYECNQGDHNMLGYPAGTSYLTYQPFRALHRS